MGKKGTQGRCKLTGETGRFVAAHIIPKALTRPSAPGLPFIQAGSGKRPVRRFDSWYDPELVTQSGEDLLSLLDSAGIELLRKHQLVWSGRADDEELSGDIRFDDEAGVGLRFITSVDRLTLRLFLLSILWRAAESDRPEFEEVVLPDHHREKLRQMILTDDANPADWYPAIPTQIMSRGPNHNLAPQVMSLPVKDGDGNQTGTLNSIRFYFDGLIVHFMRPEFDDIPTESTATPLTAELSEFAVVLVKTQDSRQIKTLEQAIAEADAQWPEVIDKLSSKDSEDPMPGYPNIAAGSVLVHA